MPAPRRLWPATIRPGPRSAVRAVPRARRNTRAFLRMRPGRFPTNRRQRPRRLRAEVRPGGTSYGAVRGRDAPNGSSRSARLSAFVRRPVVDASMRCKLRPAIVSWAWPSSGVVVAAGRARSASWPARSMRISRLSVPSIKARRHDRQRAASRASRSAPRSFGFTRGVVGRRTESWPMDLARAHHKRVACRPVDQD